MEAQLFRVKEIQGILGIGQTMAYRLIYSGKLRSVRVGRAIRVPRAAIDEYIARLEEAANEGAARE